MGRTIRAALTVLVISVCVLASAQAATLPDTPAGKQFAAWLAVFNGGDDDAIKAFALATGGDADRAQRWVAIRKQSGGFDLYAVEQATDTHISAFLMGRNTHNRVRAVMDVAAAAPNPITNFTLQLLPPGGGIEHPAGPAARLDENGALAAIRSEAEKEAASGHFSGAVMIAKAGKLLLATAYGEADRAAHVANTVDTLFRIGSMNKMFTGTAVLQLVQAGRIRLDDTVGKFLPDYPNKTVASTVTVEQLLTHTGGTGDFFGPDFTAHRLELRELKDYIARFGMRESDHAPGSKFEYSNFGYIILGRIIEVASGESYYDYVRKHIFLPASMTSTDSFPEDQHVAHLAVGYTAQGSDPGASPDALHPNTDTLPYRGTSAGGGYSTVGDLVKFADALLSYKLLDAAHTDLLITGKVAMGPHGKYGYGFGDVTEDGVRHFGHNGGAPGMNGDLSIFPASGYVVAVLSNTDPPAASAMAAGIARRLPAR